ncbi:MAG: hypothetical protein GKB98_02880, partial [Methanobacteriales archaeon]|nr:hypothetical protein [Methanobacteriales archaeon]
ITMVIGFLVLVFLIPLAFSNNGRQFKLPDGSYVLELSTSEKSLEKGHNKKALGTAVMNPSTGLPRFVHGFKTKPLGKDGKRAAKEFLKMHFDSLGIDTSTLDNAKETEVGSTKHVRFQQMYRNIPVEAAEVLVHMTTDGEIMGLSSNYQPDLDLDVTPKITADEALAVFLKELGIELPKDESTTNADILPPMSDITSEEGFEMMAASYVLLGLENPLKPVLHGPELVIYHKAKGMKKASLSWRISYSGKDVGGWVYYIDAHTGKIISTYDSRNYGTKGSEFARIYPNDGDDNLSDVLLSNGYISTLYEYYGWYWYDTKITDPLGWWDSSYQRYFHFSVNYDTSCKKRTCRYIPYYPYRYCYCSAYAGGHAILFRLAGPKLWVVNEENDYDCWIYTFDRYHIPAVKDHNHDYDKDDDESLFDSANVFYHVNDSLNNYYLAKHNFDLGYQVKCVTHHADPNNLYLYAHGDTIYISDGRGGFLPDPAWARDGLLHELQHLVTNKIYEPYSLGSDPDDSKAIMERGVAESFSDYFSCVQTEDPDQGEWAYANYQNLIRHLDVRRNMSEYVDAADAYHTNSQIYSSALWEIRDDLDIPDLTIDQLAFHHLFWKPKSFYEACNAYLNEARNSGFSTPQIWEMNYNFARQGITENLMVESFSDGVADGWQTPLGGLWHISSSQAHLTPYSLAYNRQPPAPTDYNVGITSGNAILEIKHLNRFDDADLSFWFWYEIESSVLPWPRDILTVSISPDGDNWTTILDSSSHDPDLWDPSWNQQQRTWLNKTYSLDPNELVSSLLVKFYFNSVTADSNIWQGWYIDDIRVTVDGTMF